MKNTRYFGVVTLTASMFYLSGAFAAPKKETAPTVDQISTKNVTGTWGGKNPALTECNGPFISAEFLFWNASEDGLEYASKLNVTPDLTVYNGSDLDIRGKWNPGFRLGLGWQFGHFDQWDLSLDWTCYYTKAHRSQTSSNFLSNNFAPHWFAVLGPIASSAKANWSIHFNTLDLDLGRNFFLSKRIAVRPHMGLRATWIDQDYKSHYQGVWTFANTTTLAPSFLTAQTSFKAKLEFKGIGMRAGTDLQWHLSKNWSIVGEGSGSLLYGKFDVTERFLGFRPNTVAGGAGLTTANVTIDDDYHRVRANIDASGGLQWEMGFCKDKYHLMFGASWEMSYWFSQNQLFQVAFSRDSRPINATTIAANEDLTSVRQNGDLAFQGVTLKAAFSF